jgi:hypothetical protein
MSELTNTDSYITECFQARLEIASKKIDDGDCCEEVLVDTFGDIFTPVSLVLLNSDYKHRKECALKMWQQYCKNTDLQYFQQYLDLLSLRDMNNTSLLSPKEKMTGMMRSDDLITDFEDYLWSDAQKNSLLAIVFKSLTPEERIPFLHTYYNKFEEQLWERLAKEGNDTEFNIALINKKD